MRVKLSMSVIAVADAWQIQRIRGLAEFVVLGWYGGRPG